MNCTYKDAFHCKQSFSYIFFFIAPVIFAVLSWFVIPSKVTWMHAVALHAIPGSLVIPESLPQGVGAKCLQDAFGMEEPSLRAQSLGLLRRMA